jgi:glycosyltransferase involved in cell wall biosynthesis
VRIAVFHNLHSGGAKRVLNQDLKYLALSHHVELFSIKGADQGFGMGNSSYSSILSTYNPNPFPMLQRPYGRLNPIIRLINLRRLITTQRRIANDINKMIFDVVLVYPCQTTQSPAILQYLRTPTLYYCQELPRRLYEERPLRPNNNRSQVQRFFDRLDPFPPLYDRVIKTIDKKSARGATVLAANSRFTCENVRRVYQREVKICSPGVDLNLSYKSGITRESFVLSVGALTPLKGFDFLIDSIGTINFEKRPLLVIVSNYQEPEELFFLKTLAKDKMVNVKFLVNIHDEELAELYKTALCVAYSPLREPLGLVPLEAMMNGVAVVGVAEGGVQETIIDQQTGLLVSRDVNLFGQAILHLLENPGIAQKMGEAGHRHVIDNWSWENHIFCLESLMSEAINLKIKGNGS